MNVHNFFIIIVIVIFCSCSSQKEIRAQNNNDFYEIIEKGNYGNFSLSKRTLSYDEIPANYFFTYKMVNHNNVKYNSVTEKERHINFDTIFNSEKIKKINQKFKTLKSVKLKPSKFSNPKILSKKSSPLGTPKDDAVGYEVISFPFIVEDSIGDLYGFIYRGSSMGILFIYKKINNNWEEFARLEIWI